MFSTFHTYPELLIDRGRLAQSCWDHASDLGAAIAATLAYNPDAVILRATGSGQQLRGLAPRRPGLILSLSHRIPSHVSTDCLQGHR